MSTVKQMSDYKNTTPQLTVLYNTPEHYDDLNIATDACSDAHTEPRTFDDAFGLSLSPLPLPRLFHSDTSTSSDRQTTPLPYEPLNFDDDGSNQLLQQQPDKSTSWHGSVDAVSNIGAERSVQQQSNTSTRSTARRPTVRTPSVQSNVSKADKLQRRREKHASNDALRRQRMRRLLSSMQQLLDPNNNNERTEHATILAAGIDRIRLLEQQNKQLCQQLGQHLVHPTQPTALTLYREHEYACDIRSLSTSFDSLNIAIERCDSNGVITDLNPTGEAILGYQANEVVGRNLANWPTKPHVQRLVLYAMANEHVGTFKQLCRSQGGHNMYLSTNIPYHGEQMLQLGSSSQQNELIVSGILKALFESHSVAHMLIEQVFSNSYVIEAAFSVTPVYKANGERDQLVVMSTSDMRRAYYLNPTATSTSTAASGHISAAAAPALIDPLCKQQ
jgi:PAS domain S-box-containing protein